MWERERERERERGRERQRKREGGDIGLEGFRNIDRREGDQGSEI